MFFFGATVAVNFRPWAPPREAARDDTLAGDPDFPSRRGAYHF